MNRSLSYFFALFFTLFFASQTCAFTRGIYVSQSTAQDKSKMAYLISESKKYGIDTFVIDVYGPSQSYAASVKNVLANGIHYVARIVVFPHGGTHAQVTDKTIWAKRLALAKYAIGLGASAIQLDYIRYRASNPPNPEKAKHVFKVVQYFKNELVPYHVALQLDIFGISAIKPAHTIGQDPVSLATVVNVLCPMVYPSHFEPFLFHAVRPYETVYNSVVALKKQLQNHPAVAVYPYIELFNYRFFLTPQKKAEYIAAEMKAAHDSGANGFYVWSAMNHYAPLFKVLANSK